MSDDLRDALVPLIAFFVFAEALREIDGEEPLKDSDVILHVMGAGGSAGLTMGQIRRIMRIGVRA